MIAYYFNPRSREGSDIYDAVDQAKRDKFQSTLPRRERPSNIRKISIIHPFQSTLPRRERRFGLHCCWDSDNFNPRSREGSDDCLWRAVIHFFNFNPRSREGSDKQNRQVLTDLEISIHAPAKGATRTSQKQHRDKINFNPRSREGSDEGKSPWIGLKEGISIHAPAKGATS